MADFSEFCDQFSPLDTKAREELFQNLKMKNYKKGECLLKAGETCKSLFFINQGLAKLFFIKEDKEFIMRFFSEDVLFTAFESYLTRTPSTYTVLALEDMTVTLIHQEDMDALRRKHHSFETFFSKLVSRASLKMMKRISEMLEENATERYREFIKENNHLVQRISLGDLSRYLGITQQSLSRIRAKK